MSKKRPPAMTPEAHEQYMIGLAVDLAEKKLLDGTASVQIIKHYLDLATTRAELEKEKLRHENALLEAKTESLKTAAQTEELYREAINAMRLYTGETQDSYDNVIP